MGDLTGNIQNSVVTGGTACGALGDILGQVLGRMVNQTTNQPTVTKQNTNNQATKKGIDISKELDSINGVPTNSNTGGGGIDLGSILGGAIGKGGIDLGSILGAAIGMGGIDLGSILGAAIGKGGIDLGNILGAATGGKGGIDLGSILSILLRGNQSGANLTTNLANANIGETAQSVISVIGMASNAYGTA